MCGMEGTMAQGEVIETCGRPVLLSTMWVPRIELRSPDLTAGTCCIILPALKVFFNSCTKL